MMTRESAISHGAAFPLAIRSGMTSGATGGRNDDTLARVVSPPETELEKAMKNDAIMSRFKGGGGLGGASWWSRMARPPEKLGEKRGSPRGNQTSTGPCVPVA